MRRIAVVASAIALALSLLPGVGIAQDAQPASERPTPDVDGVDVLPPSLRHAEGTVEVVAVLGEPALAESRARGASESQQVRRDREVRAQQQGFAQRAESRGARELARTRFALNSVALEVDASQLRELAADPAVRYIAPVPDFTYDIDETVELVGADVLHDLDVVGEGVTVAVLDSGIDYTHVALGGRDDQEVYPGTAVGPPESGATPEDPEAPMEITQEWGADFLDTYGWTTSGGPPQNRNPSYISPKNSEDAPITAADGYQLFPQEDGPVVGGYDFMGEEWPFGDLAPNEDPIDIGGHGTSVAAIIHGMAPEADILGIRVCASFATSCSGVALLQAIDYSLSPTGDPALTDAVDIMNFSLGALYGKATQNPTVEAVENATRLGVLTVASAGNSSDNPYISGTPSTSPSALGVAQTAVPRDVLDTLVLEGDDPAEDGIPAVHQPWSPDPVAFTGLDLQYGDGAGGNTLGCAPFTPGSLDGLGVIVDRGDCNFTLKAVHASAAGAELVIISQNESGPPFTGGDGGDRPIDAPSFMVFQSDGAALKAAAADGTPLDYDPADGVPLVGTITGSSSRGPSDINQLKPEIGAPGASIAAVAGSFDDTTSFGGTSGAAPVVSGAAALMLGTDGDVRGPIEDAFGGDLVPEQVKARLINTAFRGMEHSVLEESMPGVAGGLAPLTRIGGGEVRADAAYDARSILWDADAPENGTLSFGFHEVSDTLELERTVEVVNYTGGAITYDVSIEERYETGANSAVTIDAPTSHIAAPGTSTFDITLTIDPAELDIWNLDAGFSGDLGQLLTALEAGGYVVLDPTDGDDEIALPYQVLPRLAGDVSADGDDLDGDTIVFDADGNASIELTNDGAGPAFVDTYELIATGAEGSGVPDYTGRVDVDIAAAGVQNLTPGGCGGPDAFGDLLTFAVVTHEPFATVHSTASFEFQFDLTGDGEPDSFLYNDSGAPFGLAENNLTFAVGPDGGTAIRWFTTNGSNSTVTTLLACSGDLGFDTVGDAEIGVEVLGLDVYFAPLTVTDSVSGTFSPNNLAISGDSVDVGPGGTAELSLLATGADAEGVMILPVAERFIDGLSYYSGSEIEAHIFDVDVSAVEAPDPVDPIEPVLVEVTVEPAAASVEVGGDQQFTATASYDDDTEVDVTTEADWASDDTDVATVTDAGLATGVAEGTAEITATFDGESGTATLMVGEDVPPPLEGVFRLSGANRFETAVEISQDAFGDGEAGSVVLARGDDFADALAGTPLAVDRDGPILLTPTDVLIDIVADEIERVLPSGGTVYLLGGTAALDESVEAAVSDLGFETMRLAGPERIATSLAIAENLGDPGELLITTGFNFPDALAAGAAAAQVGGAVILTTPDEPDPAVDDYLAANPDAATYGIGGPAARAYPDATPIFGPTREATAALVADAFFEAHLNVGVARQDNFPDALAGGAHIGRLGGPILLTPTDNLHPVTAEHMCANSDTLLAAYIYGGTLAISDEVADDIADRINGVGCE